MKPILLFAFLFTSLFSFAQIEYDESLFDEALAKANTEGKLLFVQLVSPSCRECNAVAEKGLADKELSELINRTFVPLYVDNTHPNRQLIETTYNVPGGFGILFINNNGTLIHKYGGSTTRPQFYKEQIDLALYRAGEGLKVSELEKEYRNGNKSLGFLEQLLLKRRSLNLNNRELLDEYVSLLPTDSLLSSHTLQFIFSMGPELGSYANRMMFKDTATFNRAWYGMTSQKRGAANSYIIRNSLNKAVKERDERYAFQVASFARSRYARNSPAGTRLFGEQLLEFYKRTNDTAKFLNVAERHYDLLMKVNIDSIKKIDLALQQRSLDTARKVVMKTEYGVRVRKTVVYNPAAQRVHWELKEGAWAVYKRTSNQALLAKATLWVEKALDILKSPEALDVHARLLYKQQQIDKAIEIEKEAIAMKKKAAFATTDFEEALGKMQKGEKLSD